MALVYLDAAGTAVSAGVFIPRDNLNGLTISSELAPGESTIVKDCKFLAAFLATLQSVLTNNRANNSSLATGLGFTVTKSNPAGGGQGIFNQTFVIGGAQVVDYTSGEVYPIPVPTTGSNSGRGVLRLTDVFPDAVAVAASGAIAEAGVLIPHIDLDMYGAEATTSVSSDMQSRKWILALARYLFNLIPVRVNNTTPSAVIANALNDVTPFLLDANATASTNPTTGLDGNELTQLDIYSRPIQFTIQYLIDEITQTFDVRVV
jgi:hypothetical protein